MLEHVMKRVLAKEPIAMDSKFILGGDCFSMYINIPFCPSRCKHCCFETYPASKDVILQYVRSLQQEILMYSKLPSATSLEFDKLFFGRGTVGILERDELSTLISQITKVFSITPDALIGIETTPETLAEQKLDDLVESGVNAVVIGCRARQQRLCDFLGRKHSVEDSERSIRNAMQKQFDLVAVDLLFDIPTQTVEEHLESLRWAASLGVHQITVTPLIVQQEIPLYKEITEGKIPPQLDAYARRKVYHRSIDLLKDLGYKQRSLYVFTKSDVQRCFLRGGLVHQGLESPSGFLGLGLGATSYVNGTFHCNTSSLDMYNKLVSSSKFPITGGYFLSRKEQMIQWLLFSLQELTVSARRFENKFGISIQELFSEIFSEQEKQKYIEVRDEDLYLTKEGILDFGDGLRENLWKTVRYVSTK